LVPHVDAACVAHSLSGSVPAPTGPQVPSMPAPFLAREHAWQSPVHAVAQHVPSTQKVLAHWFPAVHATPVAFLGVQVVPLQ